MNETRFSPRKSTRVRTTSFSFQEEQAVHVLSHSEEKDLEKAISLSLREEENESDLDSDDASDDEVNVSDEDDEDGEEIKQESKEPVQPAVPWCRELHSINPQSFLLIGGPNRFAAQANSPLEFFQFFLPQSLIQQWVEYTNTNATQHYAINAWQTNSDELYAFIGAQIYMGIINLPQLDMYWTELYHQTFITHLFTRRRFKELLRFFCVSPPHPSPALYDPLPHVRSFIHTLNRFFAAAYQPSCHLVIDEAIVAYKGRSGIKQYIPMKPHKWGYKIWCLSNENYLLHFEVYEGKAANSSEHGATYDTVMRMVQSYTHMQHILFIDSYFTSPTLLNSLKQKGILVCGSVRRNRKGLPVITKRQMKEMKQGEWIQYQQNDTSLAVWKDQRVVLILYNHISPLETAALDRRTASGDKVPIACPKAVRDYFYQARSVDVMNQLHYSYPIGRKSKRCWPRLVWWLIDMCILNAFKLWSIGQSHAKQLNFREQLMFELTDSFITKQIPVGYQAHTKPDNTSAKYHYPVHSEFERDCVVCSHQPENRTRSRVICSKCGVHLCIGKCFSLYHSNQ